jgi:hypothetical protein
MLKPVKHLLLDFESHSNGFSTMNGLGFAAHWGMPPPAILSYAYAVAGLLAQSVPSLSHPPALACGPRSWGDNEASLAWVEKVSQSSSAPALGALALTAIVLGAGMAFGAAEGGAAGLLINFIGFDWRGGATRVGFTRRAGCMAAQVADLAHTSGLLITGSANLAYEISHSFDAADHFVHGGAGLIH